MTGANNPEEVPSTRHPDQRKNVELMSTMRLLFFLMRFLFLLQKKCHNSIAGDWLQNI